MPLRAAQILTVEMQFEMVARAPQQLDRIRVQRERQGQLSLGTGATPYLDRGVCSGNSKSLGQVGRFFVIESLAPAQNASRLLELAQHIQVRLFVQGPLRGLRPYRGYRPKRDHPF